MSPVLIRDQQPTDLEAVHRVLTEAFRRPVVAELSDRLAGLDGPGARLIAELEGCVVGQVQLSTSWVDAPRQLVEVLVLSPLGVDPAYQRQSIGSQLVRAALVRAEQLLAPALFLEGSPQYYPRFGFSPGRDSGFSPPSARIPDPAFQVVTLTRHQPWMAGALVYPDVFWRLDCVGLRDSS